MPCRLLRIAGSCRAARRAAGVLVCRSPGGYVPVPDVEFRIEVIRGVPVVIAPEEIDITNAPGLRSALLQNAS